MTAAFDYNSTTDQILSGVDLSGKRALVTGVSAGLGIELARTLVAHGVYVIGTARDLTKAEKATQVVRDAATNGGNFEIIHLDLNDLSSVRAVTEKLVQAGNKLDYIFNNAGIWTSAHQYTKDGFESHLGVNTLGHFVLTNRLLPVLKHGSRVVFHTSNASKLSPFLFDDPSFKIDPGTWTSGVAYGSSKTGNILNAVAFDNMYKSRGIRASSVHPGVIFTELSRDQDMGALMGTFTGWQDELKAAGYPPLAFKEPSQGAATAIWAGIVADGDEVGGKYCEDCSVSPIIQEGETQPLLAPGVQHYAVNPKNAEKFWALAEDLVGEKFE